jgi:hypothetical protein
MDETDDGEVASAWQIGTEMFEVDQPNLSLDEVISNSQHYRSLPPRVAFEDMLGLYEDMFGRRLSEPIEVILHLSQDTCEC